MSLQNLNINKNFLLAPLAGYTDSPYRRIIRKYTNSLLFTEMISSEGVVRKNKKTYHLLNFSKEERPLAFQIFGSDPEIIGQAVSILEDLRPDVLDLNLGCPAGKVCKAGAGAALLLDPVKIRKIIETIVKKTSIPVSGKIRLGWDNKNKNYNNVIQALIDGGISFISVHGRTKNETYQKKADWETIKEIQEKFKIPIIGNGDIATFKDGLEKLKFSGCKAVMIGRATIGNPWIFTGQKPTLPEKINQIKEHLNLMLDYYQDLGLFLMRKHLVKYIHNIKNASKIRVKLLSSTSKKEIFNILEELF